MDILYLLVSHLIGRLSYGSFDNFSLASIGTSIMPLALLGGAVWLITQYWDEIFSRFIDQFVITATFESSNQAYGAPFHLINQVSRDLRHTQAGYRPGPHLSPDGVSFSARRLARLPTPLKR